MKYARLPEGTAAKRNRLIIEDDGCSIVTYRYKHPASFKSDVGVMLVAMEATEEQVKQVNACLSTVTCAAKKPNMRHSVAAICLEGYYINMEWDGSQGEYPFSVWVMDMHQA